MCLEANSFVVLRPATSPLRLFESKSRGEKSFYNSTQAEYMLPLSMLAMSALHPESQENFGRYYYLLCRETLLCPLPQSKGNRHLQITYHTIDDLVVNGDDSVEFLF